MARLLFIDDDRDAREIFQVVFESTHQVLLAEAAGQALEMVRTHPPDLVVVDLGLNRAMDGLEVLMALQSDVATRTIPVVVLTGREGARRQVEAAGGAAFLLKPVSMEALVSTVEALLPQGGGARP